MSHLIGAPFQNVHKCQKKSRTGIRLPCSKLGFSRASDSGVRVKGPCDAAVHCFHFYLPALLHTVHTLVQYSLSGRLAPRAALKTFNRFFHVSGTLPIATRPSALLYQAFRQALHLWRIQQKQIKTAAIAWRDFSLVAKAGLAMSQHELSSFHNTILGPKTTALLECYKWDAKLQLPELIVKRK